MELDLWQKKVKRKNLSNFFQIRYFRCSNNTNFTTSNCRTPGEPEIMILGEDLLQSYTADGSQAVISAFIGSFECKINFTSSSDTKIVCSLEEGEGAGLSATVTNADPFPNALSFASPSILDVSGQNCELNGTIVTNCRRSEGLITITGSNFGRREPEPAKVLIGGEACTNVNQTSHQSLTCQLDVVRTRAATPQSVVLIPGALAWSLSQAITLKRLRCPEGHQPSPDSPSEFCFDTRSQDVVQIYMLLSSLSIAVYLHYM